MTTRRRLTCSLVSLAVAMAIAPAAQAAGSFSPWSPAINAEQLPGTSSELNSASSDGCPIQSPDGLSLYMASNRPRFAGDPRTDLDIWVAQRSSTDAPWGAPQNVGQPVNSTADDFCPTPVRAGGLFFVSRRVVAGSCGGADIFFARRHPTHGWEAPRHLGCGADGGPNSALDEMGPSYVEAGGPSLYFSRGPDIVVSEQLRAGVFGPAVPVGVLNSTAQDIQPNVRHDGREIVFASNRGGPSAFGAQDLWVATRDRVSEPWSDPVNLGPAVNTTASETRPSLSRDAETLHFGRAPAAGGPADIYVSTRTKHGG